MEDVALGWRERMKSKLPPGVTVDRPAASLPCFFNSYMAGDALKWRAP